MKKILPPRAGEGARRAEGAKDACLPYLARFTLRTNPTLPSSQAGKGIYLLLLKNYAYLNRQILMRRLRGKAARNDVRGRPHGKAIIKKYCRNEGWE